MLVAGGLVRPGRRVCPDLSGFVSLDAADPDNVDPHDLNDVASRDPNEMAPYAEDLGPRLLSLTEMKDLIWPETGGY